MTTKMPERATAPAELADKSALTEAQAARARKCPLCRRRPGRPCQAKPEADHLARYLDACTAGQLSRAYLATVVGELVVIHHGAMIPGGSS
jgi:hypothetical protein